MTDIVFLDTETTGIHPEREIWELAMVKRFSDGEEDQLTIQITDIDLSKADPFALKINKFYDRYYINTIASIDCHLNSGAATARTVEEWTRGCHIVGAVPNFDTESLDKLLRQNKLLPGWHYHLIDVEALAIGFLRGKDWAAIQNGDDLYEEDRFKFSLPWKSDELSRAIGVEPPTDEERHTAMGDVRWAMRTYDRVMGIN